MATKKYDYPQSTHLVARIQCVIDANSRAKNLIRNLSDFALTKLEGEQKRIIEGQIDDAMAALELASRAICGEDAEN